jgi:hypothetical protein
MQRCRSGQDIIYRANLPDFCGAGDLVFSMPVSRPRCEVWQHERRRHVLSPRCGTFGWRSSAQVPHSCVYMAHGYHQHGVRTLLHLA